MSGDGSPPHDHNWPRDLIHFLNQTTRDCRFDWKEIHSRVTNYIVENKVHGIVEANVSVAVCREVFAAVNTVQPPAPTVQSATDNQRRKLTSDVLESLTLEELIEHVEKTEQEMNKRKEEIFQRVLHSLGGSVAENSASSGNILQGGVVEDDATIAYHKLQQERDEIKRKQEERIFEQRERERLAKERDLLRKRFDADSEDAQGEYPTLSGASHRNRQDFPKQSVSANAYIEEEFDEEEEYDEERKARNEAINSMFEEVSMEQILSGYEFDVILSELEKELDAQAVGKDDGEFHIICCCEECLTIVSFISQRRTIRIGRNS